MNNIYMGEEKEKKVTCKVVKKLGVLSDRGTNTLELRLVSWNGAEPKYDLRPWKETDEGERSLKGITISGKELEALYNILKKIDEGGKPSAQKKGAKKNG